MDLSGATPDFVNVDGGLDDLGVFGMIIAAIVLVIVAIFLALVLFNVIAIALELLIVILLLLAGVFSRVVLRRPWVVQASTGGPPAQAHAWKVVGWLRGRRVIADVASQLASGSHEPRPAEASGVQLDAPRQHG